MSRMFSKQFTPTYFVIIITLTVYYSSCLCRGKYVSKNEFELFNSDDDSDEDVWDDWDWDDWDKPKQGRLSDGMIAVIVIIAVISFLIILLKLCCYCGCCCFASRHKSSKIETATVAAPVAPHYQNPHFYQGSLSSGAEISGHREMTTNNISNPTWQPQQQRSSLFATPPSPYPVQEYGTIPNPNTNNVEQEYASVPYNPFYSNSNALNAEPPPSYNEATGSQPTTNPNVYSQSNSSNEEFEWKGNLKKPS